MSIPIKILQADGTTQDAPFSVASLNELALREPEGIYTVARTFERTKAVLFDAHLDRLEESAHLEQISTHLDRDALRRALLDLLDQGQAAESRFRITIPKKKPEIIWLAAEPLQPVPQEFKMKGVYAATCTITRPNPKAKSNAWINLRLEASKGIPAHVYEGIILENDYLMEGFSSNFYAIRAGVLYTADTGILQGIARRIVLSILQDRIPLEFEPIRLSEVSGIDEAFLTSSSRGIVPIVHIDEFLIGDGIPGPKTLDLSAAYDQWVLEHLEPIYPG